jgi:8-oxo-dGTP diphosphatase
MKYFGEKLPDVQYIHRIGSYAVIIENNCLAVVPSDVSGFMLIGGGLEEGESETDGLRREAIEEIGFELKIGEKLGVATEYLWAEIDQKYFAKECHFYRAELMEKINSETEDELIWLPPERLGEMYHQCHQWIVEEELKHRLGKTAG